jgi:sensor histidine kinase YesM
MKEGGLLNIRIVKYGNKIIISIKDNGIGIEESKKQRENGTGSGIRIMHEIYEIHNQRNEHKITYKLINLYKEGERGTVSVIEITV